MATRRRRNLRRTRKQRGGNLTNKLTSYLLPTRARNISPRTPKCPGAVSSSRYRLVCIDTNGNRTLLRQNPLNYNSTLWSSFCPPDTRPVQEDVVAEPNNGAGAKPNNGAGSPAVAEPNNGSNAGSVSSIKSTNTKANLLRQIAIAEKTGRNTSNLKRRLSSVRNRNPHAFSDGDEDDFGSI